MKLYLAIESEFTNDGIIETTHGVFSTPEKAMAAMSNSVQFKKSIQTQREWCRIYQTLASVVEFEAVEVELDKERFT